LASLWIDGPWRYGLWALGLALDLVLTFTISADRKAEGLSRRMAQPTRRGRRPLTVSTAHLDTAHFGERLGLFTIIVLGEGVLVVVQALVGALALTATLTVWLLTLAVVVQLAAKPRKSDVEATA
jgi:low temperature requirement protein LtrA